MKIFKTILLIPYWIIFFILLILNIALNFIAFAYFYWVGIGRQLGYKEMFDDMYGDNVGKNTEKLVHSMTLSFDDEDLED